MQDVLRFLSVMSPGQFLFLSALILYGAAFALSFLMGTRVVVMRPLMAVMMVILFLLLGTVAVEFSSASTPSYTYGEFSALSEALATHRWLLFQLPIVLTVSALLVLAVYHEHLVHKHARMYRSYVQLTVALGFASLVVIGIESLL